MRQHAEARADGRVVALGELAVDQRLAAVGRQIV
jgi:hypothetical protein